MQALLLAALRAAESGLAAPNIRMNPKGLVWYAARREGRLLASRWIERSTVADLFHGALRDFQGAADGQMQICLTYGHRQVPSGQLHKLPPASRGLLGLELSYRDQFKRVSPLETISENRSLAVEYKYFLENGGIKHADFRQHGTATVFAAHQFLVQRGQVPTVTHLFRGNRIVKPEHVSWATIDTMIQGMASWMFGNLEADGGLVYKYWPSQNAESAADNPIRRFMATISMARFARLRGTPAQADHALKNLAFNLKRFYKPHQEHGIIEWDGSAKLGSCALAALAIIECGAQHIYGDVYHRLLRGVDHLWQPNGSFRSFHIPAERNDNQNFYPGEAMLLWATLFRQTGDMGLLKRCLLSFNYYRAWHRANRNPAFVPWHSQALTILFHETGREELRDFVFEMNDWLLPLQQWGAPAAADLWGRFYDPAHPEYGPPHASATAVYLEGLADALMLARESADAIRIKAYRQAIWRAVRSLRQLQFLDETDFFYAADQRKVFGGVRTEVYNNEIRVDNVQHALMGLLKYALLEGHRGENFWAPCRWRSNLIRRKA